MIKDYKNLNRISIIPIKFKIVLFGIAILVVIALVFWVMNILNNAWVSVLTSKDRGDEIQLKQVEQALIEKKEEEIPDNIKFYTYDPVREQMYYNVELRNQVISAYTLSPEETDDTPCIGAWGDNLCEMVCWGGMGTASPFITFSENKDKEYTCFENNIIANNYYPKNSIVIINGVEYELLDRMNSRYGKSSFVILMNDRQDALNWGRRTMDIELLIPKLK